MVMESIFIRQNYQSGIIFVGEKHLNSEECSYKDAFVVEKSSLREPEAFSGCM